MQFRANTFEIETPESWTDETVYRFISLDREERITIRIEHRLMDVPLEQRLLEKTATVREGVPFAELIYTRDALLGPVPAKAFLIEGQRGDEEPLSLFCLLGYWADRELMLVEYEGPTARWKTAEPMIMRVAASLRRPSR